MKINSIIFAFLAITALPAFSQSTTVVERTFACSLIGGYTIQDAVSVMRAFEWDEDFAPGAVLVREAAYGSTSFREDWDFVVNLYYPSMADLTEKRLAFRARTGGSEGYDLTDVARCSNAPRLNSVDFVPGQANGDDPAETTVQISTICDRNGAPLSGVVSAAENIANLMGPNLRGVQIVNRQFGGPTQTMGSQVGYRLTFNTPDGFATAMDTLRTNQPEQAGGVSCNVPSAWLIHRVYSSNN
jgi:hypothetical protein